MSDCTKESCKKCNKCNGFGECYENINNEYVRHKCNNDGKIMGKCRLYACAKCHEKMPDGLLDPHYGICNKCGRELEEIYQRLYPREKDDDHKIGRHFNDFMQKVNMQCDLINKKLEN